jgi:poly(3-hydroxybutyrate) depolymerase
MKKHTIILMLLVASWQAMGQAFIAPYSYVYDPARDPGFNTSQYEAWLYQRTVKGSIQRLPFRMLKPVNYNTSANQSKKYPLIVMLHGRGESGVDNNFQLKWGGEKHMNAVNNAANPNYTGTQKYEGFVVFPQEPYGYWVNNYLYSSNQATTFLQQVWDLVDSLKWKYRIDPDRVVVHGLSSGGSGTWACVYNRPDLFAAALPMSAPGDMSQVGKIVPVPIWLVQGGKDTNPIPYLSQQIVQALRDSGALNIDITRYTEYADLDHVAWDRAYDDPDFFPYMERQNKRNIMVLSNNPFCFDGAGMLGISPGYSNYQWFKNGVAIANETNNKLRRITSAGSYHVRYKRKASDAAFVYSDTVYMSRGAFSKANISANESLILPSPSASAVTLSVAGYDQYQWSNGATSPQITVNYTGAFRVRTRNTGGCWTSYSDTAYVRVGNTGTPIPAVPNGLAAVSTSPISVSISWKDNANNETGYEIYRATQIAGPYSFVKLVAANNSSYLDNTLFPSANYFYKIRAVNKNAANLSSEYAQVTTMKDMTMPSVPNGLSLSSISTKGVEIKWNRAVDQYPIRRYLLYNGNAVISYLTDTTYLFTQLMVGGRYNFSVEAEDYSGNMSGRSAVLPFAYTGQGLFAEVYQGTFFNIPDFSTLKVAKEGMVTLPSFNWDKTLVNSLNNTKMPISDDLYALNFTGYVYVNIGGNWTFYTASDDGSKLFINNTLVVNNDYLQGTTERSGMYNFAQAGWYPIRIEYFEKAGGQQLEVSYQGPKGSTAKMIIPANSFATTSQGIITPSSIPVVNAGLDKSITLPKSNITLAGSATDADGTISAYLWTQTAGPNNATLSGSTTPTLTASNLIVGIYTFRLKATDSSGASATDDVTVTVISATASSPTLAITAPTPAQIINPGSAITIQATASDSDGIAKLEFFTSSNVKIGEDTWPPYSYTVQYNTPVGNYSYVVTASDKLGNKTSATVSVKVEYTSSTNLLPVVSIISPTNGTQIASSWVTVNANCSDLDGTIARVEFFDNNAKIGEDNWSPYSYTIYNLSVGTHALKVIATDDRGGSTTVITTVSKSNVLTRLEDELFLGIEESASLQQGLVVYPNPSDGLTTFQVQVRNRAEASLNIVNMEGQTVYSSNAECMPGSNQMTWQLDKQKNGSGFYFYQLKADNVLYNGKLLVR